MSTLRHRIHRWIGSIRATLHSSRGKDYLVFLLFLCVSYAFWLLLTLNNEIQEDLKIPVELVDIPEGTTLITDVPASISVSVRDKGTSLTKFVWGSTPTLRISFAEIKKSDNRIAISETELNSRLRAFFGQTSQIISSKPDSISIYYTTQPGRKVKLQLDIDATASMQCAISGPITMSSDSVMLYSINALPTSITTAHTVQIVRTGLIDTTYVEAHIATAPGCRAIPDKVTVCIPVEPLIAKTRTIPIDVVGVPPGLEVLTFPSQVKISYLIPMSRYSMPDDYDIRAIADYSTLISNEHATNKLALKLPTMPTHYYSVSLSTDSVEYIIEQGRPL